MFVVTASLVVVVLAEGAATCCQACLNALAAYARPLQSFSFQNTHFSSSTPSEPPHLFASPPSKCDYLPCACVHEPVVLSVCRKGVFSAQEKRMQLLSGPGSGSGTGASANHGIHGETEQRDGENEPESAGSTDRLAHPRRRRRRRRAIESHAQALAAFHASSSLPGKIHCL